MQPNGHAASQAQIGSEKFTFYLLIKFGESPRQGLNADLFPGVEKAIEINAKFNVLCFHCGLFFFFFSFVSIFYTSQKLIYKKLKAVPSHFMVAKVSLSSEITGLQSCPTITQVKCSKILSESLYGKP